MTNKFLGINSVNVLKKYIDEQITSINDNTRLVTIQAYTYAVNSTKPDTPVGGGFDTEGIVVTYPDKWFSLSNLLRVSSDGKPSNELLSKYKGLDEALSEGSVWMSAGVAQGSNEVLWSTPMKVSGQNGVSVRFKYTYSNKSDITVEEILKLSDYPKGVDPDHRVEYVWTQSGENPWQGPTVWAVYAQDANMVYWRYCVTGEDEDGKPIPAPTPGGAPWVKEIPRQDISEDNPYMWMSYQIVPAGATVSETGWSEPILFGHYGRNGDVPDYTQNLYCKGTNSAEHPDLPGIIAPEQPKFVEGKKIEDYITNGWLALPGEAEGIWWMCTFQIKGRNNEVLGVGPVKRYNGVDGTAKPGPYTKYLYNWSKNQNASEVSGVLAEGWRPDNWYEKPDYDKADNWDGDVNSTKPEASLWMLVGVVTGLTEKGYPIVESWSEPIKVSGPRGPIAYDYRVETRYSRGTETKPELDPEGEIWSNMVPTDLNSSWPYVWAQSYLVYYKMKYSDEQELNGDYKVVQDESESLKVIDKYGAFRISGLNGENGNTKNNINYTEAAKEIIITNFSENNYFISNSAEDVIYNISIDPFSFINGYTGKFSNIGTGDVIINAVNDKIVSSGKEVNMLTLDPQETVELICYNNNSRKQFILIGKSL